MLPRCPVQQRSFLCSSISRLQPRYLPNHDADLFSEMVDIVINGIPEVGGAVRLAFSGLLGRLWKVRGGGTEGAGERLSNFFTRNLRERKITFSDAATETIEAIVLARVLRGAGRDVISRVVSGKSFEVLVSWLMRAICWSTNETNSENAAAHRFMKAELIEALTSTLCMCRVGWTLELVDKVTKVSCDARA